VFELSYVLGKWSGIFLKNVLELFFIKMLDTLKIYWKVNIYITTDVNINRTSQWRNAHEEIAYPSHLAHKKNKFVFT